MRAAEKKSDARGSVRFRDGGTYGRGRFVRLGTILVLVYGFAVLLLHAVPTGDWGVGEVDLGFFRFSHLTHLVMFAPWGAIGLICIRLGKEGDGHRILLWLVLGFLLAAVAEGIQYWLPYRSFTWTDMAANFSGVALGAPVLVAAYLLNRGGAAKPNAGRGAQSH